MIIGQTKTEHFRSKIIENRQLFKIGALPFTFVVPTLL
jgi:hypothetical protein